MSPGKNWERRRRKEDNDWVEAGFWSQAWSHLPHGAILVVVLLGILTGGMFAIRSFLLPAEEELRREVYEESKSYRDGTIRDLDNLRLQWLEAEGAHKTALAATARHRASDFPREELPDRVREWLDDITP